MAAESVWGRYLLHVSEQPCRMLVNAAGHGNNPAWLPVRTRIDSASVTL
jgi:hypothetical protein